MAATYNELLVFWSSVVHIYMRGNFWLIAPYFLYTHQYFINNDASSCLYRIYCHVGSLISLWQSVQPMGRLAMVVPGGRIHTFMSPHVPLCTVTNKPPLVLREFFQSCKLLFWCKYNCTCIEDQVLLLQYHCILKTLILYHFLCTTSNSTSTSIIQMSLDQIFGCNS